MDQRGRLIVELLRNLTLASESAGPSGVRSTSGERVPMLAHEKSCRLHREGTGCTCWLASIAELQRCLRVMYGTRRRLFRAVYERYVVCDCRPRTVVVKANKPRVDGYDGPFEVLTLLPRGNGTVRARVETWRADITDAEIREGIAWLSSEFNGNPRLPTEWRIEEAA